MIKNKSNKYTNSIKNINDDIDGQYKHLMAIIESPKFLLKQGLGNDLPFYIYPFKPSLYNAVTDLKNKLIENLSKNKIKVCEINLFELSIKILKSRNLLDDLFGQESSLAKDEVKELLQNVLNPENYLIPELTNLLTGQDYQVLFITGIGEVYPFIRSHNVLNNLQSTVSSKPMILFFPGKYTHSKTNGASLDLFEILHDDRYYRAFNIFHCDP